jgi:hypothetical protein
MVGQRDCGAAVVGRAPAEVVYAARAIQKRVFTMDVEVYELTHWTASGPL